MAALRYRWLLPAAHAAIDVALALMLVHRTHVEMERDRPVRSAHEARIVEVASQQESVGWDLREVPMPDEVVAIQAGTLPAAVAGLLIDPRTLQWPDPFDRGWFALHTGMALLVWYGIGRWLDRSRQKWLRVSVLSHLGFRACAAPLTVFAHAAYSAPAQLLLSLAWCALAVYLLWRVAAHALRRAAGYLRRAAPR